MTSRSTIQDAPASSQSCEPAVCFWRTFWRTACDPPIGYEVARLRFDEKGTPTSVESFVSGWLLDGGRAHFGRLMGIAQATDGSLLVGDDTNGVIYRISYERR